MVIVFGGWRWCSIAAPAFMPAAPLFSSHVLYCSSGPSLSSLPFSLFLPTHSQEDAQRRFAFLLVSDFLLPSVIHHHLAAVADAAVVAADVRFVPHANRGTALCSPVAWTLDLAREKRRVHHCFIVVSVFLLMVLSKSDHLFPDTRSEQGVCSTLFCIHEAQCLQLRCPCIRSCVAVDVGMINRRSSACLKAAEDACTGQTG